MSGDLSFGLLHLGRSWTTHQLEDECPCPQEPCGLVSAWVPGCEQHDPKFCRSMRQGHSADQCPGGAA